MVILRIGNEVKGLQSGMRHPFRPEMLQKIAPCACSADIWLAFTYELQFVHDCTM